MAALTPFSQGHLLKGVSDPVVKGGVCVALCDYWLALMKAHTTRTPRERMTMLRTHAASVIQYQKSYAQRRRTLGRSEARAQMGRQLGHRFEDQTMVLRAFVGMQGVRARMSDDLDQLGAAATWTMAMPGAGRHAIAGFRGLKSVTSNIHIASLHVFDPNVGEYVGTLQELDGILRHLFQQFPEYALVSEVNRTTDE